MTQKFSLSPTVVLRSEPQYYGTFAAFDYNRARTEFLTEEEYRALERIYDKSADAEEISEFAGMHQNRCDNFLKHMLESRFIERREPNHGLNPPERTRVDPGLFNGFIVPFISGPASVDVFITSRCNLKCVHCFSAREEGFAAELSAEDLDSIFSQLEQLGVFEVRINGGEPFLHPEIEKILLSLKERRFRKVVITNGTLLNEKLASLLKESGTIPTVSIDDSLEEEHDLFRGVDGSFKLALRALRLLSKHGVQYGINCCLHKRNLKRYQEIISLVAKHGASRIAFLDLKKIGRMKNHTEWIPSYKEYRKAMIRIMSTRSMNRKIDVSLDVFLHCQPLRESIHEAGRGYVTCQAGKTFLAIDGDGSTYPCNLVVSDPRWNMGNILNERLVDIWFSQKWSFFRGGVKVDDLKTCRECKSLKRCKDFYCRLLPYVTHGDPHGPNPRCI